MPWNNLLHSKYLVGVYMARELEKIVVRDKNTTYCYNPSILGDEMTASDLASMFDVDAYRKANKVLKVFRGRGETYLVADKEDRHFIIRHYWRGGFIGKYLKDRFLSVFGDANRAEQEFNILTVMLKIGLPVPKPVVSRMVKNSIYCRNDIIVQEIQGARSLFDALRDRGTEDFKETDGLTRHITIEDEEVIKIGQCIGMMLASGVYHSDLNIHNILIDGAKNPWIIDFDKCSLCTITPRRYKKIVDRLVRSIDKEKMLHKGLKWSNKRTELLLDVIAKAFNANAVKKDILVGAYAQ